MPTFQPLVENPKGTDKRFRIKILVNHTCRKQKKRIPTEWYVEKEHLIVRPKNGKFKTERYKLKSPHFKRLVEDRIEKYRKICDAIPNIEFMSVDKIVEMLTDSQQYQSQSEFKLDFIEHLMSEHKRLLALGRDKMKTAGSYQTVANSLKAFLHLKGRTSLDVNELTAKFVLSYTDYLKGDNEKATRKCGAYPGVIYKALGDLKYLYNDEESGVEVITVNPSERIKQGKRSGHIKLQFESPEQAPALSIKQIKKIINLKTFDSKREELARDVFLLSFMLVGMNTVDIYSCTNYSDGKLIYNRSKVKGRRADNALMKVKVEPEVLSLFGKYKNRNRTKNNVFHFSTMYTDSSNFNKAVNKGLETIGKKIGVANLTSYSARTSWSTIATIDLEINEDRLSYALNHEVKANKTARGYVDKERRFEIVWKDNRRMLDNFDWTNL